MFDGKTAIVTGASSGLGAAMAETMASFGANVGLFDLNDEGLQQMFAVCRDLGAGCTAVQGDVTKPADCQHAVEQTVKQFGRLDYLIACAGVSMWARFEDIEDVSIFRKIMDINYLGTVHCVYSALPHLKETKGMVVAISSIQGKIGVPLHTGYVASKHAVQGFFESLRGELNGTGVDVLTVLPHWIRGTNLRKSAFAKDGGHMGESNRKHSKESVTVDDAVHAITKAMRSRKRELYIPWKLKLLPWLRLISPSTVESLVRGKVDTQE